MDSAALAAFIGDGVALAALVALGIQTLTQRQQLRATRQELADQKQALADEVELSKKRDDLVETQLTALRRQLGEELKRQALQIDMELGYSKIAPSGVTVLDDHAVWAVTVINRSDRPVRQMRAGLRSPGSGDQFHDADAFVRPLKIGTSLTLGPQHMVEHPMLDLLKSGDATIFLFAVDAYKYPHVDSVIRFEDDNEVGWQTSRDLSVAPVVEADWPPLPY
ncbi:MAG TPA: hypothetical protein VGJ45_35620 [Pseudonocardiaceae bacterium]